MTETTERKGFAGFLRENWLFIAAPFVLIVVALLLLFILGGDSPSGFLYNIF
ncbi:MAG: hypothetical protein IPJ19_03020 [Planctomycetes bacterium]|nr:hypothetical protein [Planctomycetota bacterium]